MIYSTCKEIPELDRDRLFIQNNIFVPVGSRCCEEHIIDDRLKLDALNRIRPYKIIKSRFSSTDILIWFDKFRNQLNSIRYFDFDRPFEMSDDACYNLTGVTKSNFDHLINILVNSKMRTTFNRSIRNAVGLFLTKLRLGISNKVLTTIFQFSNAKAVSRTLSTVRQAMISEFVPLYVGFNNITRQDIINNHSSPLATRLLSADPNSVVLVIDGTYLYMQVCSIRITS
jgi:hypothetical protein